MKKLLTYIQSIDFAVLICLMAMISQAFHSFYSFWAVSSIKDFLGAIQTTDFVIVFEFFTLFFLLRGHAMMARFSAICLLVMNLYYYWTNPELTIPQIILGTFIAFIIPIFIYNTGIEIKKQLDEQKQLKLQQEEEEKQKALLKIIPEDKLDTILKRLDRMDQDLSEIKEKKKPGRIPKSLTVR